MKKGDKVKPRGLPNRNRPGIVQAVEENRIIVTWRLGSGWDHTVEHDISEIEQI